VTLRSGVFLDRDGVLNRVVVGEDGIPHPPASTADVELLQGVDGACAALRAMGHMLVIVTNQPDVARGTQSREVVEGINKLVCDRLGIDHVRVCYHDDRDGCACRKPQPGLIVDAAKELGIDREASFMIGERSRDIEAGKRAGCLTVLVGDGYGESLVSKPDAKVASLADAATWIHGLSRLGYNPQGAAKS
jgi:D-glycero-D-manno-heptose 1,7-bisphosphate phosphatase